jgi:hypothetical protein
MDDVDSLSLDRWRLWAQTTNQVLVRYGYLLYFSLRVDSTRGTCECVERYQPLLDCGRIIVALYFVVVFYCFMSAGV